MANATKRCSEIITLNNASGALYFLHDDMLGTPQLATDGNQAVAWQASYDSFGQASVSGTITQNLRLPGQYFDLESGWNHNGFRDYAPQLGRYVEPDPLGRLGSGNNLYAYVGDNPINFADPLGLCPANGAPSKTQIIRAALNQKRLHACSQTLFGNANALTAANAPKIQYLSTGQMSAYLGGYLGAADAAGANNPAKNTVYFNSSVFTGNLPFIYYQSNYLHEAGNILSFNLYGNETARGNMFVGPNEYPVDPDSGASFERCIFGQRMQIP